MDQFLSVFFLGLSSLLGFIWILNTILDTFSPHPQNLPAPKITIPGTKPLLNSAKGTVKVQEPASPTRKEPSLLQKEGVLPDGNNAVNHPDNIIGQLEAALVASTKRGIFLEERQREFAENTGNKLQQLEAALDAVESALMQAVQTWKSNALPVEQDRNVKPEVAENSKPEDLLQKNQELEALVTEMSNALVEQKSVFEERVKQLEVIVEGANRQLLQLKDISAKEIMELKASNEANQAALKLAEDLGRGLEDKLMKATQEADALRIEKSEALAEQKALSEERIKQLELATEEVNRQFLELKETSAKDTAELRSKNENNQASLKLAEELSRGLEDKLVKATQEAEALKIEKSAALSEQKSLFEGRIKQHELVTEEVNRQLLELKESTKNEVMELKASNDSRQAALKLAEEKVKTAEETLLKQTEAAESLANEQAAALAEAIETLQQAVKHAKEDVSGKTNGVEEKEEPVGYNETLEEWLVKHGLLTRVPPKTWMQLLEHTGSFMVEKANSLKSKADRLFHHNPADAKTG